MSETNKTTSSTTAKQATPAKSAIAKKTTSTTTAKQATTKQAIAQKTTATTKAQTTSKQASAPKTTKATTATMPKKQKKKFNGALTMKRITRFAVGLLVNVAIIYLLVNTFSYGYNFAYDVFADVCKDEADTQVVSVHIEADSSILEVCQTLNEAGVVKDYVALAVKLRIGSYAASIQPGVYQIAPSNTSEEIITIITGGTLSED